MESTLVSLDGVSGDPQVWANAYFDDEATALAQQQLVFSSTLDAAEWSNSVIIGGDPAEAVAELKEQGDGDLVMYGHGPLGQALLERHLIDELRLWIHRLLVGQGTLLFRDGARAALRLAATQTLTSGVVILTYQPA
jgi:dihydrofolate reductase